MVTMDMLRKAQIRGKRLRGQYFSFDAIVAVVIFVLALVTILSAWNSLRTSLEHQSSPLSLEAMRIGDILLTPGNPADAACADMDAAGLAVSWKDRRVNGTKLEDCSGLSRADPDSFREKLGVGYRTSIYMNGIYVLGDALGDTSAIQEIGKARKIISLHNETRDTDGNVVDEQDEIAVMEIYVFR